MQLQIKNREQKLDQFFLRAKTVVDDETKSDLARLGLVLVCGYIEQCVQVIIITRLTSKANPNVLNFIKSHFKNGKNYDWQAICELLRRFDHNWEKKFSATIRKDDKEYQSLRSAYGLRNSIAHGGDGNRGLSGVEDYYNDCKMIVEALIEATKN